MSSLGDRDDETQPVKMISTLDDTEFETQPFESQSPSEPGKKLNDDDFDELPLLRCSMPFDDTVPLEDAFETQAVNLAGETQVLDDSDIFANMETQLLDECDVEVVDTDDEGTEFLNYTQELSDDDSVERVGNYPVDLENKPYTTNLKQVHRGSEAELEGLIFERRSSGSERRSFTSVRAAALRASGLSARRKAFKVTISEPCCIKRDGDSPKEGAAEDNGIIGIRDPLAFGKEVDQEDFLAECNEQMKGLRNESNCRVGSSTVRRLFMDDTLAETEGPDNYTNNDVGADLPQLPACGNEMAGLSYVDSQEPGDLSQANALDFVDRFLTINVIDFDKEVDIGRSTGGKSKPVSSAKGTQSLAKRTNLKTTAGERGTFDWDNRLEDEGGGDFFTKKKEVFFDNGRQRQRSFTGPQKRRHLHSKGSGAIDESRDKEEQCVRQKVNNGLANSDSGLVLHKAKRNIKTAKVTETKSKKNLTKEFDHHLNIGSSDGKEATATDNDLPETHNLRFDTQMAAEAMEELCFGLDITDCGNKNTKGIKNMYDGSSTGENNNRAQSKKDFLQKISNSSRSGVLTRKSKKMKSTCTQLSKESTISSRKRCRNERKLYDTKSTKKEVKKAKLNAEACFATNGFEDLDRIPSEVIERTEEERASSRNGTDEVDKCHVYASLSRSLSVKKQNLQKQVGTFTPITYRTRKRRVTKQLGTGIAPHDSGEEKHLTKTSALNDRRQGSGTGGDAFPMSSSREKSSTLNSKQSGAVANVKLSEQEQSHQMLSDTIAIDGISRLNIARGRRTQRKLSGGLNGSSNLHGEEKNGQSLRNSKRLKTSAMTPSMDLGLTRKTNAASHADSVLPSMDKGGSGCAGLTCNSVDCNVFPKDMAGDMASKRSCRQIDADTNSTVEDSRGNANLEVSPGGRCKPSGPAFATPVSCATPINAASPVCMGDEYLKQSCRKNLSRSFLTREINSLTSKGPELTSTAKDSRRRRDMANVRVLFSHHLDGDIIKQQKKILARLGASVASSISEASHFATDKFVRTRNMLEAIAFGKPVVTHLWLESCGQASCFIDERNYILRDAKKEKEFGFSLPVSLARACQHPLLQGQKVFITPNTKPGKEILASLVKAVRGLAVERIGRSAFKDDKCSDGLLVLSCEEDLALCVPFLEKGEAVYSSELLLNGIVTQKLEYERHRLFVDHVKKTRSTIWLKQGSDHYRPVTKRK